MDLCSSLTTHTGHVSVNLSLHAVVIGEDCFSVQLSWNVSQTNRTGKVVIEKFMLDYSLTNSNATRAVETITLGGGVHTYVFPPGSLKQNTNYSFTLRAGVKHGDNNLDSVVDIGHFVVTVLTPLCSGELHHSTLPGLC